MSSSAWLIVVALAAQAEAPPADKPADKPAADAPPETPPASDPATAATTPEPVATAAEEPVTAWIGCPKHIAVCFENDIAAVWPKLRVRTGFDYVDPDPQLAYVGQNDGFFMDQARIGAEGTVRGIAFFKLTLEGASVLEGDPNQPVNPLLAAMRDAWVGFRPSPWLDITVGQQNMPADYEGTDDVVSTLPFARRSVVSTGVRAGHGNAVDGLSPSRQVGLVVGSGPNAGFGDIGVHYRLGITNGNGQNVLGNDNKLPALYLRLGGSYGELVKAGIGGRFNPRTVGTLPNLYSENDAVGFVDAAVHAAGFEVVGIAQLRQTYLSTLVPDLSDPDASETGVGVVAWLAYDIALPKVDEIGGVWHVKPAFRSSFYDPSSAFQTDALLESTLGARLTGQTLPLSLFVDYTFLTELGDSVATRDIADNRFTILMQLEL